MQIMNTNELYLRVIAGMTMEIGRETLKKVFPHLTGEIEAEAEKRFVGKDLAMTASTTVERTATKRFNDYNPDVIDFICRCDNEKQAHEIIDYVEKRGEIDKECARKLRIRLKKKGVRSFGAKREEGYYLREFSR
jgi:hypothetical protein